MSIVPRDLLATARRSWLALLAAALLGGLLTNLVANRAPEQYQSTARLLVGPLNGGTDTLRASGLLAQTYAAVLTSDEVLRDAALAGGVPAGTDTTELRTLVEVVSNDRTRILSIEATLPEPERALAMTTSLTDHITDRVSRAAEIEARTVAQAQDREALAFPNRSGFQTPSPTTEGRLTVLDTPQAATEPVRQPVLLFTLLGGLLAAGLALAIALFAATRGQGADPRQLRLLLNQRLLGTCRLDRPNPFRPSRGLVGKNDPDSARATDYRLMAAKAELMLAEAPLSSVAVFGAQEANGSGEVAANLALSFARGGRLVAFVDLAPAGTATDRLVRGGDERQVQRIGGYVLETCTVLSGKGQVAVVVSQDPALRRPTAASETIVSVLLQVADLVVVHAPPLLLEPATVLTARQVDGVAVVVSADEASADGVADAMDALERANVHVLGAILAHGRSAPERRPSPEAVQTQQRVTPHTSAVSRPRRDADRPG